MAREFCRWRRMLEGEEDAMTCRLCELRSASSVMSQSKNDGEGTSVSLCYRIDSCRLQLLDCISLLVCILGINDCKSEKSNTSSLHFFMGM